MDFDFDQTKTLKAPPIELLKSLGCTTLVELRDGVAMADACIDSLPARELASWAHGSRAQRASFDQLATLTGRVPTWSCDAEFRESVARGQCLFNERLYAFITLLIGVLLNGLVIARFSEVLVNAGYSRSPRASYMRFRSTAVHVWRWHGSSLFDVGSSARRSVLQVRCLHALARRSAERRSDWRDDGEGRALSQYDLALVLLGFSGVSMSLLEHEFHCALSERQRRDHVATWRWLGHLLGVDDRFNVCESLERCEATLADFFKLVPTLVRTARPSSVHLLRSCIDGFGRYTPIGRHLMAAVLFVQRDREFLDLAWTGIKAPPPPIVSALDALFELWSRSPRCASATNTALARLLTLSVSHPKLKNAQELIVNAPISSLVDLCVAFFTSLYFLCHSFFSFLVG
jgi:ER-bound oxygenase mpaB/B'/Rubber oxygenase, catalytic domain